MVDVTGIDEGFEREFSLGEQKYPFGPIFTGYYEEHGFHMDLAGSGGKAELLRRMLYDVTIVPTDPAEYTRNAKFIPGSTFDNRVGPHKDCRVMLIGKIPDDTSAPMNRDTPVLNVVPYIDQQLGYTKDFLYKAFTEAKIPESVWRKFYVTSLCRFPRIDAGLKKTLPAAWVKEGLAFVEQELRICKPDIIVCMGTDASKKITGSSITKAVSNVFEYDIEGHTAKVICVYDPKKVIEDPEVRPLFMSGLSMLKNLLEGGEGTEARDRSGYHYIDNVKDLRNLVDRLLATGVTDFAIDCEWGGKHFLNHGAALRTVQLAWSETECAVVILRRCGMRTAFEPYIASAFAQLRRLLQRPEVRFVGHGLSADFPWLKDAGLDLSSQVYFDTMLASHLFEPTMSHKLEDLATKHIPGWVRQDFDLSKWLDEHPGIKENGYGDVPDRLLHPYGGDDVISTFMLYKKYQEMLKQPENKGLCDLFYTLVMPALLPLIGIESTGVYMDRERVVSMQEAYSYAYDTLLERFRRENKLPNFNPNSASQKQDLLFGTLKLQPVKTTGKPPMMWDEVEEEGLQGQVTPAVDGETLEILSTTSKVAQDLHHLTLLATVLKNQLVPPTTDSHGNTVYLKGFAGFIKPDGRIHTRISQMLKTGRLASLDPNIMNIANRQESAVQKLFKSLELDVPKLRSAFMTPPGKMLIVADYKQAEIGALAYASGDENLIRAVQNGDDIHSVVCKQMFQLDCTLSEIKKHHKPLRIAAKSIVFGLLYGRGAKAIAREVSKAGVETTVEEAKAFVEKFMTQFPKVARMIEVTHDEVEFRGWVETLWGRRAFYPSMEGLANAKQLLAGQKRKGFNFKIQGYVGDLLRSALINFSKFKRDNPSVGLDIILTVHDSIMAEVPIENVEYVANTVFPLCMSKNATCPSLPFEIGIDIDVSYRWDEKLYLEDFLDCGFTEEFASEYCKKDDDDQVIPRPESC